MNILTAPSVRRVTVFSNSLVLIPSDSASNVLATSFSPPSICPTPLKTSGVKLGESEQRFVKLLDSRLSEKYNHEC